MNAVKKAANRQQIFDTMQKTSSALVQYIKSRKEPFRFTGEYSEKGSPVKSSRDKRSATKSRLKSTKKSGQETSSKKVLRRLSSDSKRRSNSQADMKLDQEMVEVGAASIYQPKSLKNCVLKEHQIEGLNWLIDLHKCNANGILADQMGLGKTVQTIAFLAYLNEVEKVPGTHLIIAPLIVTHNWKRELAKFYPECSVLILSAKQEDRDEHIHDFKSNKHNILITSYEGLSKYLNFFKKIYFEYFIVDEAHRLKNDESNFHIECNAVRCKHRLLLTGTPLSNETKELWSLLNFIMPSVFSSRDVFEDCFNLQGTKSDSMSDQDVVKSLHEIMSPFMLRRLKQDTSLNLPQKKEILIYCPVSLLQKKAFTNIIADNKKQTEFRSGSLVMDVRKAAIHPYLFKSLDTEEEEFGEHLFKASGKFAVLDKLLKKIILEKKEKVLVFSLFTTVLNIVEDCLNTRGFKYFRIDGDTQIEDRNHQMEVFNSKQMDTCVFLLSTKAGGLGINLVAANNVIFIDSDWNPQVDLQAMDRAHRIGQTKPVTVYRLITKNTVEEKIIEKQTIKLKLDYLIIERGRKINQDMNTEFDLKSLNEQELKDLAFFGANHVLSMNNEDMEEIDINKLIEEGEKAAEEKNEFFEDKVKEYTEKITELNYERTSVFQGLLGDKDKETLEADRDAVRKAFMENLKLIKQDKGGPTRRMGLGYAKPVEPAKYVCRVQRKDYWEMFGENEDRIYELEKKRDYFEWLEEHDKEIDSIDTFTESDEKELEELLGKGMNVLRKEYYAFVKGICTYGRHNIEDIHRDNLPEWSINKILQYSELFWNSITYIPSADNLMAKILRAERDLILEEYTRNLFKELFAGLNSSEDLYLPEDFIRSLNFLETKFLDPSLPAFLLFQESRTPLTAETHKLYKELMKSHECLQTNYTVLSMDLASLQKLSSTVVRKFLSFFRVDFLSRDTSKRMPEARVYDFKSIHDERKNRIWLEKDDGSWVCSDDWVKEAVKVLRDNRVFFSTGLQIEKGQRGSFSWKYKPSPAIEDLQRSLKSELNKIEAEEQQRIEDEEELRRDVSVRSASDLGDEGVDLINAVNKIVEEAKKNKKKFNPKAMDAELRSSPITVEESQPKKIGRPKKDKTNVVKKSIAKESKKSSQPEASTKESDTNVKNIRRPFGARMTASSGVRKSDSNANNEGKNSKKNSKSLFEFGFSADKKDDENFNFTNKIDEEKPRGRPSSSIREEGYKDENSNTNEDFEDEFGPKILRVSSSSNSSMAHKPFGKRTIK
jgi:superfamily II DNA/RNA helicase